MQHITLGSSVPSLSSCTSGRALSKPASSPAGSQASPQLHLGSTVFPGPHGLAAEPATRSSIVCSNGSDMSTGYCCQLLSTPLEHRRVQQGTTQPYGSATFRHVGERGSAYMGSLEAPHTIQENIVSRSTERLACAGTRFEILTCFGARK